MYLWSHNVYPTAKNLNLCRSGTANNDGFDTRFDTRFDTSDKKYSFLNCTYIQKCKLWAKYVIEQRKIRNIRICRSTMTYQKV